MWLVFMDKYGNLMIGRKLHFFEEHESHELEKEFTFNVVAVPGNSHVAWWIEWGVRYNAFPKEVVGTLLEDLGPL